MQEYGTASIFGQNFAHLQTSHAVWQLQCRAENLYLQWVCICTTVKRDKKRDKDSKVIFPPKWDPFMQTVIERLAEVNTSPTQIPCICLYLSRSAVKLSSSLKLSNTPAGFYSKPTNMESKGELIWLADSSLLHLLLKSFFVLLHSLLVGSMHQKMAGRHLWLGSVNLS